MFNDTEAASAIFLASAAALQSAIPTPSLPVLEIAPGVGMVQITFFQYRLAPLIEPYVEMAVGIMVLDGSLLDGYSPLYILYLPVTTEEAMIAGIQGWGFPKTLAKIRCHYDSRGGSGGITCKAKADDLEILTLELNTGSMVPVPPPKSLVFTVKDGLLVKTNIALSGNLLAGMDFGGAKLILGDHPIGQHLRALGVLDLSVQHLWAPSVQDALYFPHACAPLH